MLGYPRPDGRVGIRNHLLIVPTTAQTNLAAKRIARQIEGAVALQHPHGSDQEETDAALTLRTLAGMGTNPNVGAALVVGFGYEQVSAEELAERIRPSGKPVESLTAAACGGTVRLIEEGAAAARRLAETIQRQERVSASLSHLILGTNCGGSDATSGIASNPSLGVCSDKIVDAGGTVILSETTELIGAESILLERCADEETRLGLLQFIERYEAAVGRMGHDMRGGNPSPGNIAGGLTTIEEKSLGCVSKGGSSPVRGVVTYAEPPGGKGLWIMDTPGNDIESVCGMVAGGAQVVAFTTGRGTPTGNPVAPVIKVCGNPHTCARMPDNIDVDVSPILTGGASVAEMGEKLFQTLLETARGRRVKAEILGHAEFNINRIGATA